jgi:hypothetical protein
VKFKSAKEMGFYDPEADQKDAEVTISARKLKDLRDERDKLRQALQIIVDAEVDYISKLRQALQIMVDAEVDYISRNHLGDPDKLDRIRLASEVLARFEKTVRKE